MLSVLIPAYNEEQSIRQTIDQIRKVMDSAGTVYEIIVIDDGSTDRTSAFVEQADVRLIRHPSNGGYGRALKSGLREACYDWVAIVDADSSYPIDRLPELLRYIPQFDMVVGSRTGIHYRGTLSKRVGRLVLGWLVSFVVGQHIPDINSGFRIFRKDIALTHVRRISSGFSFTTTLTLAMFLEEHFVTYVPVDYYKREGKSKVKFGRDVLRMLQILIMAILYYNPLKLYLVLCVACLLVGVIVALLLLGSANWLSALEIAVLFAFLIGGQGFLAESIRLNRLR